MSLSPFDIIKAISETKEDVLETESEYSPWIVNKGLSLFPDTLFYANDMNMLACLDNQLQYEYLINTIRSRRRYSKWPKKKKENEDLEAVIKYYNMSPSKAKEALLVLKPNELKRIKEKIRHG